MAALTEDRVTASRDGTLLSYTVASGATCYAGGLAVILAANGQVRPGVVDGSAPTCVPVGRFKTAATAGETVEVEPGIYRWNNHATDTIDAADIGKLCYVADDQTVAATDATGTRGIAGVIVDLDSIGVWVDTRPQWAALA